MDRGKARDAIEQLVSEFAGSKAVFKDPKKFDEAKVRAGFIDPFFEALGWAVKEGQRRVGKSREVVVEDRAGRGLRQRPDYGFYINGELKFYVEAKASSKDLTADVNAAAFQLKSYVWSQRAPLGVLTNFEQFITYHGAFKPRIDKPELGRVAQLCLGYDSYLKNFDLLFDTFSREAVLDGSIERLLASVLAATARQRGQVERDLFKARGAKAVDDDFLAALTRWREELARELAHQNDFGDSAELTEAVQRLLDRIIFSRVAEDRGIERSQTLWRAMERWDQAGRKKPLYGYLVELFRQLSLQFNGGLFAPHPLSEKAKVGDGGVLVDIIKSLYFPEGQYKFDVMPVELLGAVYEKFLGSVVRVSDGGRRVLVEEKPEVRHAGGVYYTPRFIVEAIVERTLGPLVEKATPDKVLNLRIIDPACGSGSFLLGAYQYLLEWHLRYYAQRKEPTKTYKNAVYRDADGVLHLTLQKKREILSACIYGVDLDPQAVEVAQMSLYLKLLEGEAEETLSLQRSLEMWKADKYLPNLARNLMCGNALLESGDLRSIPGLTQDAERRINAFDWMADATGFGRIMRQEEQGGNGGFDAVIGNPPYIRVQALAEFAPVEIDLYKRRYASAAEGNYDIYVAFIERSLSLLRDGGRSGFIIPTKWWQAAYGAPLRRLLFQGRHYAEAFDFAHEQVFDDPTTYTCISLFTKAPVKVLTYHRASPPELRRGGVERARSRWEHALTFNDLGEGPWYPGVPKPLRTLFDRLRREGPFLNDPTICPRVFQGLKTSLDPVYVFDVVQDCGDKLLVRSKALDDSEILLERGPLKKIVKGREMKRFAPLPPEKVVLFPYAVSDDTAALLTPKVLRTEYPAVWEYLRRNKKRLEEREGGRMRHSEWYAYIYPKNLTLFERPKLLTADLANKMAFSVDGVGELYLLGGAGGGYGLLPAREELTGPLLALLNSSLMEWMLRPPGFSSPFRGGWFSCEARFINLLPIRLPKERADTRSLGALAERAVSAHKKHRVARTERDMALALRQIEAVEREIDDRVFRLYGVLDDERRAIEQMVMEARIESGAAGVDSSPA